MAFTLSFIIARYAQATVYKAFVVSALMFFIMSAIGRVTKKKTCLEWDEHLWGP